MFEKFIVDRIEGEFAVCEVSSSDTEIPKSVETVMKNIPLSDLPAKMCEGSHLMFQDGIYTLDEDSEQQVRDRIDEKMRKLFNR